MKAVIVPGITDLNKGDQALVWESHRLAMDTGYFEKVYIVSEKRIVTGGTESWRKQSRNKGFEFIENILKHPRRDKHHDEDAVSESFGSFLQLALMGVNDFCNRTFLTLICNNQKLVDLFYDETVSQTIKELRDCDVVFVKGGGFIHAYGEKTAPYLMWFFLFYVRLGFAMGKKVIFLPNSYGPFEGLTVKDQVRSVFNKLDKVYAREELSANKLGELLNRKIQVSPDLGFYLKMSENGNADKLLVKYGFSSDDKIVGITIRPWRFPGKPNPEELYEKYIASVAALADHVLKAGYKVALCNQSIGPNSHEDDRNAIKELMKRIQHPDLIWINEDLPCDELKALYSKFYIFIGTRFHSVIFSLTSLVPSMAIGYGGNKAKGIMSDFDLGDYTILIENTTAPDLIRMFDQLVVNHEEVKVKLQKTIVDLDKKREIILEEIREVIR